ncbi:DUF5455 family protein [Ralstonia pseudosolanacearum]|uniref:Minor coat protein n=1 Tax=Ralstonia solanacearum TaxID=305 RepID=A0A0S4WUF8_RALSL|nr:MULTISPECIES: DUF5455 family protein [Ralstonia]UZF17382.1 minor coat protein [Ralstonia solanacearum]MCD9228866.1 minor coat protein [Ralstonia pseudosolanacearum]MCK4140587.1 DUF5455 family protein [Ralstonia pseudosolanacearum]RAA06000.1 hypothetical protein DOT66_20740 [Ralstonia pseudosolanacearum]UQY85138.1 DUF5455 family protein [Ralstonia pseudosolanacearum]
MPILGALLSGLLTWLGSLFGELMVRRIANNLLLVGVFVAAFATLVALMKATASALFGMLPTNQWIAMGVYVAFPPVSAYCLSAVCTVWAGCALYRWQLKSLELAGK